MNSFLLFENWSRIRSDPNASIAFDNFCILLKHFVDQSSEVIGSKKSKLKKLKPWMSNYLLEKIDFKNKLRIKCKKHSNNVLYRENYDNLCKEIRLEIPICKENFYMDKFHKAKGDLRKEWGIVNELFNKNKTSDLPSYLSFNSQTIVDHSEMAKIFNDYFIKIAVETIENAGINNCTEMCSEICFKESFQSHSFLFQPITSFEIFRVIQGLDSSHSSTSNSFSIFFIKKVSFNIVDIISLLFNKSIFHGNFPSSLKIAEVIPIP